MGVPLDVGDDRFFGFATLHFAQAQKDLAVAILIVGGEYGENSGPVRAQQVENRFHGPGPVGDFNAQLDAALAHAGDAHQRLEHVLV